MTYIKYLLIISFCLAKVNINNPEAKNMNEIPLSDIKMSAIFNYIDYSNGIDNIYQLLEIEEVNSEDIRILKKFFSVQENDLSEFIKNQKMSSYKLEWWFSSDGNQESLSDIWLDRFFAPKDINSMSYDEIYSLPNISPIDAVGVMKQKERGVIKGTFELKNSPGLSYYGYKNMLDFIKYEPQVNSSINFRYSSLFKTLPITSNPDEEGNSEVLISTSDPETLHRLNVNVGNNLKLGLLYHQNMGESGQIYTDKFSISYEDILGNNNSWLSIDKVVVGNYNVAFGQGVILETTDFFSPRRTGYGFTKRSDGISADVSRSSQYLMKGLATQMTFDNPFTSDYSNLRLTLFASKHPRDAIVNQDGSFCSMITMQPRLDWGINGPSESFIDMNSNNQWDLGEDFIDSNNNDEYDESKLNHSLIGSVEELTWGGNLRFSPNVSTTIGFTIYESLYDRVLDASRDKIIETILVGDDDLNPGADIDDCDNYSGDCYYGIYMTNSADPEIDAMYSSEGDSPIWEDALSYRRVIGFDFSKVYKNIAFQGEYGEISDNQNLKLGKGPSAFVLNSYMQFDNFNLLLLYRNYDLNYDNPYQRSFSNYQRFKTTIFEDTYWLEDPAFGFLYSANPQPQAEEGLYIASRYQVSRSLVATLNWDFWNRKADNSKYYRIVSTFNWRPVFNWRFKLRQKWQARGDFNIFHPSPYYSRETRLTAQLRLSSFNNIELLYSNGHTTFSPRPRLTDNVMMGDTMIGDVGSPDESIGFTFTHNFSPDFKLKFGGLYVDGFLWYIEDSDFRVFNEESGAFHSWVACRMIVSNNLTLNLKASNTKQFTSTTIVGGQTSNSDLIQNPTSNYEGFDFRVQLDYVL